MKTGQAMTRMQLIRKFLKGAFHYFLIGGILACFSTGADMLRPKVIQYTIDGMLANDADAVPAFLRTLFAGGDDVLSRLWIPALLVIGCSLFAVVLRYSYQLSNAKGGETFVKNMRDQLFSHIEKLPVSWHSAHKTGDIIQRCTSDVEEVKTFIADQMVALVSTVLLLTMALIFQFKIDIPMGLATFSAIPVLLTGSMIFHRKIGESFQKCDENEGVLSTICQENLTGVRVVRAFGREAVEQKKFEAQNEKLTSAWVQLGVIFCTYFGITDFVCGALIVGSLVLGSYRCVSGALTVGEFLAVMNYLAIVIRPTRSLGRLISEMSKTGVSMTRLCEIMNAEPELSVLKEAKEDHPAAPMQGDIEFDHVTFAYPGQEALIRDVSFTIPSGTTLGILGGTGSGKTTLAELLCRMWPLEEGKGEIRVGGVDLRELPAEEIRKNIGYVLQEPFLFSRSIMENIRITRPQATEAEVRAAARAACLETVVDGFPKGFETFVGERGVTLSGGQKQRTAMARTLLGETPILIFDDSLSAVDAETDARIRENLKKYMGKATVILISHRIATLMAADQILVLEDGAITARGTHRELLETPGLYRTIYEIQNPDALGAAEGEGVSADA